MTAPIAVTCGEPAGIGPEILAKAYAAMKGICDFFVIGDGAHFRGFGPDVVEITTPADCARAMAHGIPVLHRPFGAPAIPARPDPRHAPHVIAAIDEAVSLAQSGAARAICTLPIHKKALIDGAGFGFAGHTEYLAHLAEVDHVVMMLACAQLRVVPATIHVALADVPRLFDRALLERVITLTHAALRRDFGLPDPRIAVAGLNPHAGEGGAMGDEEEAWMRPLIAEMAARGMAVTGPHSADTMFHDAARARYDVAICAYHDQALIPIKTLDFAGGVNVTLGLPFIRTSPDHGTGFDIAGRSLADPSSLIAALHMAGDLAKRRASGSLA